MNNRWYLADQLDEINGGEQEAGQQVPDCVRVGQVSSLLQYTLDLCYNNNRGKDNTVHRLNIKEDCIVIT